jgi:hypothetical protein
MAASFVFGAWPAWSLTSRAVVSDLKRHVGEEGRQPGGIRIGKTLVVCQVALSLLLLTTGGLFLMSAISAATAHPGFDVNGGVLAEVDASLAGYDEARGRQLQLALVDRLRAVPGVEAASIGSSFPFSGFNDSRLVAPVGGADAQSRTVDAVFTVVGRDYARVLGLPVLTGRDFSDAELLPGSAERVAMIDDALAQRTRVWHECDRTADSVSRRRGIRFETAAQSDWRRAAINHSLGNAHPFPHVYVPLGQRYESAMTLHFRTSGKASERAMLGTARSRDQRRRSARTRCSGLRHGETISTRESRC